MRKPRRVNTRAQIYVLTLTAIALCLVSLSVGLVTNPLPRKAMQFAGWRVFHASTNVPGPLTIPTGEHDAYTPVDLLLSRCPCFYAGSAGLR